MSTMRAALALASLLAVAVALCGCGGLPASPAAPTTATVKFAAFEGTDEDAPLVPLATVIIGGVRGEFVGTSGKELTLRDIPFGDQDPPQQPMTVTALGYRTLAQQLTLKKDGITYVEVSMEKVDLTATGTVSGSVRSTEGSPLVNALVSFTWGEGGDDNTLTGFTDKDGAFIVGGISVGSVTVEAVAAGYLPERTTIAALQPDATGTNSPINFYLLSGSTTVTVRGVVKDLRTESPLAGASVTVDDLPTVLTDANGRFAVADVLVGTRTLRVTLSGYDDHEQEVSVLPGMADVIVVLARTSSNPPSGPYTVAGTVTDQTAAPLADVEITAFDRDRLVEIASDTTGDDGRYYLFVPKGRYEIRATYGSVTLSRYLDYPGGGRIIDGVNFIFFVSS